MRLKLLLAAMVVSALGCPGPGFGLNDGGAGGGSVDAGPAFGISAKGTVRFKRNERLTFDFGNALSLPYDTLCKELGQYSCSLFVHPLALGGVDAYGSGLYEPLPFTGVTSPLVVDRIALAGCSQRVEADLASPLNAVIFKNIKLVDGKVDPTSVGATAALDALYKRVMQRPVTASELAHLAQLNADIVASGKPDPGRAWLTLSCFAVLTSVESIFY